MPEVDYTRLSPNLKQKLEAIEANKPANQQLKVLRELAEVFEEVAVGVGSLHEGNDQNTERLATALSDIRELLSTLNSKEEPEQKDFSKPVVDSLKSLEKALTTAVKAIDIKPEFKPNIQVQAPKVDVSSPDVEVDLSGVERILKTDVPKAFKQAIASIPQTVIPKTDFTPIEKKLEEAIEWLHSIDNTSRIKPQFPTVMKVTNTDGSPIFGGGTSDIGNVYTKSYPYIIQTYNDGTYDYFCKSTVGTALSSASWQIFRLDSSASKRYAGGSVSFNKAATDLSTVQGYTYS